MPFSGPRVLVGDGPRGCRLEKLRTRCGPGKIIGVSDRLGSQLQRSGVSIERVDAVSVRLVCDASDWLRSRSVFVCFAPADVAVAIPTIDWAPMSDEGGHEETRAKRPIARPSARGRAGTRSASSAICCREVLRFGSEIEVVYVQSDVRAGHGGCAGLAVPGRRRAWRRERRRRTRRRVAGTGRRSALIRSLAQAGSRNELE